MGRGWSRVGKTDGESRGVEEGLGKGCKGRRGMGGAAAGSEEVGRKGRGRG